MAQEEKDLLLQDLCARLPYNVLVLNKDGDVESFTWQELKEFEEGYIIKPYLRPMSSMTDEEIKDLEKYTHYSFTYNPGDVEIRNIQYQAYDGISFDPFVKATFNMPVSSCSCVRLIKWLNSHHFDYCGLIEKGLALEAPEGMYIIN